MTQAAPPSAARRLPPWPEQGADALERELLARWKKESLFAQVQEARKDGAPFVFYEGPPTANGRPGIHHVLARTIKDLFCRFQVMQGRSVTRIAGWDTHGLPVEIEVEKKLAFAGKRDIEAYGVAEFNRLCRESVFTYQQDWVELSDRIAYWLDYDHPYITCSPPYIESVWWLLKQIWAKGLLIRGHRVLPYCPRCGTVLSSHELAQGYQRISDRSVYVSFPLADGSGRELVIWTTAPWTIPSNVGVAVHPDLEYAAYRDPAKPGRSFIVAVSRAGKLAEILGAAKLEMVGKPVPGSALAGLRYRRPMDIVPLPADLAHQVVVSGDFVSAADGSGLVHLTPAFGADDFAMGQQHGLALVRPVAADGTFHGTTWPELEGRLVTADETNDLIIRRLREEGRHLRTEAYGHDYPHCWRCGSKLIYYARDSWFVRTSAIKDRLLALNAGIHWHPPDMGTGRFGDWLANNVDWALSRDRYWGTPLPVWISDRDPAVIEVIGSYEELTAKLGRPLPTDFDPHKPGIDALTWPDPAGGTMRRVTEVIDTWFDSGSMPYGQWHYPFEHRDAFERHFPADLICEGVDQTRGWFYSLLAIGATVFDRAPYRHVVVNEQVLDAAGQKMSKTGGNIVEPWELIREFGADGARLYLLAGSEIWKPKRFDRAAIPEVAGGFLRTLRSAYTFHQWYAPSPPPPRDPAAEPPLDRWLRSRLAGTVAAVSAAWGGYDATAGVRAVLEFVVDDLSNWWIRQSRARFWAPDREAEPAAVRTLHDALLTVSRLLAPAAPFASDWLHRALTGESVHLARFPEAEAARDPELEGAMAAVRRLASLARAAREAKSLKVRQPLRRIRVAVPPAADGPRFRAMLPLLAQEVNVKEVEVVASDAELVRLRARPNFRALGKRYGSRTPAAATAAAGLLPEQLRELEAGRAVTQNGDGERWEFGPEDVTVEREVTTDWLVQSAGSYVAALDPVLTDELRREGLAREAVNRIQRLRKDAGYEYTTRIALWIDGPAPVLDAVRAHAETIRGETLARALHAGKRPARADREEMVEIDGHQVTLAIARYAAGAASTG
ncbi:MAG TPA: isoleucine--tRNA ligase [Gemmatimonadales bacterium]|jgi:isoleucyl-tRNA synthetase|nr:isoleucine--tRNA ligase [Gemmatimonadales bacterium]